MLVVSYHLALTLTFFILIFVSSYSIALKSMPSASPSLRLIASCSVFAWLLSILFAVFASFGIFQTWPAVIIAFIGSIATRLFIRPPDGLLACFKKDYKSIHASLRAAGGDLAWWTVFAVFFLLCALFVIRGLCLPLLGWDALTYHELKAGMWVQSGGWHTLEAPGGWEYYRTFFGGGEVFIAWAMLFCHSDLLSSAPDLFWWLLLGLSTFCLARQSGIQPRPAIFISLALICAPPFIKLIGTGYVDTGAYALLLCGLCLLARSINTSEDGGLYIAAAALGVASSIKINICAMIVLLMVPAALILFIQGRRSIRLYLSCAALFLAPVLPWLAYNVVIYGYPLGSTAFCIGPIVLGKAPPNLVWFLDWPDLHSYESEYEWEAFWRSIHHYGAVLALSVFGVPGVLYALWRRSAVHILAICLLLASIALYLHPSFSVIRLVWAGYNARFLILIVILPAVIGLSVFTRFRRGQQFIEALSIACITTAVYDYFQQFIFTGYYLENWFLVYAFVLVALAYLIFIFPRLYKIASSPIGVLFIAIMFLFAVSWCERFRCGFRSQAYAECTTMHDFPRYWVPALEALDSIEKPAVIAFAYGPEKMSHNAYLAPFLGAHLENSVVYVPPDKGGAVPAHSENYFSEVMDPDFQQWLNGLVEKQATHLLCLRPASNEVLWAQRNPILFKQIAGAPNDWGLFEVNLNTQKIGTP